MGKTRKNRGHKKRRRTYKKRDFSSGEGMLTTVWGPPLWHFLHVMSFNYPVKPSAKDKKHYKNFIMNLQNILPCRYCRENLKKNFKPQLYNLADDPSESINLFDKNPQMVEKLLKELNRIRNRAH